MESKIIKLFKSGSLAFIFQLRPPIVFFFAKIKKFVNSNIGATVEKFHRHQGESRPAESFEPVARCGRLPAAVRRPQDEHRERTGHG